MSRMVAFCGVVCSDCPAYQATQANDPEALARALAHWREDFDAPHITLDDIICDGCQTAGGRLNGYCRHCPVRPCGVARGIANCAHCDEYVCSQLARLLDVCDGVQGFFAFARQARATLADIREAWSKGG